MATGPARHRLMTESFEDVERLIWDVVHKFHQKHGFQYGSPQELFSQGCIGFMHAYQTYDMRKGSSFPTYVRHIVNCKLLELIRTETKHRMRMRQADEQEVLDHSRHFSLGEFLDEMSEDAKAIVMLILDTPADLLHAMQGEEHDSVKYLLRQYLVGMGWAKERVEESYTEIAHALS